MGLYAIYFIALFRIIRTQLELTQFIWLYDIDPERVWILMKQIAFARSLGMFGLEEDLFAKLIFVMRSPEVLIKYTRPYGSPYDPDIIFEGPGCVRPSEGKPVIGRCKSSDMVYFSAEVASSMLTIASDHFIYKGTKRTL